MYCMWWHLKPRTRLLFFRCIRTTICCRCRWNPCRKRIMYRAYVIKFNTHTSARTRESYRTNTFSIAFIRLLAVCKYCEFCQTNGRFGIVRRYIYSAYYAYIRVQFQSQYTSIWFNMRLYWNPVSARGGSLHFITRSQRFACKSFCAKDGNTNLHTSFEFIHSFRACKCACVCVFVCWYVCVSLHVHRKRFY